MKIQRHDFVMEQGVPKSIVLEYNKEIVANDLFAVVRSTAVDEEIVAKFDVVKIENTDEDVVSTFKLTLDGDIPPGRYVYDVFSYTADKPKSKLLKGYILVKSSVSDRGRDRGNTGV